MNTREEQEELDTFLDKIAPSKKEKVQRKIFESKLLKNICILAIMRRNEINSQNKIISNRLSQMFSQLVVSGNLSQIKSQAKKLTPSPHPMQRSA